MPYISFIQYALLTFFVICVQMGTIFKAPDTIFYSHYCVLGLQQTGTYTCGATPLPQTNIHRIGLTLTQISKQVGQALQFQAWVLTSSDPSMYSIGFVLSQPAPPKTVRIGFFIVFIKVQTTPVYIDLVQFNWTNGNPLDNWDPGQRNATQSLNVLTQTQFSSRGTANNLKTIPFTTYFKIQRNSAAGAISMIHNQQFNLTSQIVNSSHVDIILFLQNNAAIHQFGGIVILYDDLQINNAYVNHGLNLSYIQATYHLYHNNTYFNLSSVASSFGPPFISKCIVGLYFSLFQYTNGIDYQYWSSNQGNIQTLRQAWNQTTPQQRGHVFCFGIGSQCQEETRYYDILTNTCHIGSDCPLPIPSGWTNQKSCPNCTQQACKNCSTNRSQCIQCKNDTFTFLNTSNNRCECIIDYYESEMYIDTSHLGQWNNESYSLKRCKVNCSAVIPGCIFLNCTNSSYCFNCSDGYFVQVISSTQQICGICSVQIFNCIYCNASTWCTLCIEGYYVLQNTSGTPITARCQRCQNPMTNCINCSDSSTCLNCSVGYYVGTPANTCVCNSSFILNCTACIDAFNCSTCQSGYYPDIFTGNCSLCSNIAPACTLCSNYTNCTSCTNNTYALDSISVPSYTICTLCNIIIPNCTQCNNSTICTNCDLYYGLNSSFKCQKCDLLLSKLGCLTCQDSITCLSCNSTSLLVNNTCLICDQQISNCKDCVIVNSSFLDCANCSSGYYLVYDNLTNYYECKSCANIYDHCFECDPYTTGCTSCLFPYVMGSPGICDQCVSGYEYNSGFCMKLAGCQSSVVLANSTQVCIACIPQLNFVYSTSLKKCICKDGYKQIIPLGMLAQCVHVCGDGILSLPEEQCDDQNLINNDGCDQNCQKQPDFKCDFQPSKCVLYLNIKTIIFSYAYRVVSEHKGMVYYQIEPRHIALSSIKWDKLITFNFSHTSLDYTSLKYSYSASTGQLQISFTYKEELENTYLEAKFVLDPNYIVSSPLSFPMVNRLNGINFPLTIESDLLLSTHKNISMISFVIMILLLLQFYMGSYFHKMIGLQTIQCIQIMYFIRMLVYSNAKNIMSSMNSLQYSATGYQNSQIIFGSQYQNSPNSSKNINPQFMRINLSEYFLLNVNFCLIPVAISLIVYLYSLITKYAARNKYMQLRDPQLKDKYIKLRRSCLWIYDHFVFPYTIMFNSIVFFNSVLQMSIFNQNSQQKTSMEIQSFSGHTILLFITTAIYSFQLLSSLQNYLKFRMTRQQKDKLPQSLIQKLQHDQNNIDRANYHPFYIFIYLISYFLIWNIMIIQVYFQTFTLSLQILFAISLGYFIFIWIWKPYHQSINIHNHFLKVNHGLVSLFLLLCMIFQIKENLSTNMYVITMYLAVGMIFLIPFGGFVRIIIEKKYRKRLEQNNKILDYNKLDNQQPENQENKQGNQQNYFQGQIINKPSKKLKNTLINNQFSFDNQLRNLAAQHGYERLIKESNNLKQQDEQLIIKKIRQEYNKRNQNLLLEQMIEAQKIQSLKHSKQKQKQVLQPQQKNNPTQYQSNIQEIKQNRPVPQQTSTNIQTKQKKKNNHNFQQNALKILKLKLKRQWDNLEGEDQLL